MNIDPTTGRPFGDHGTAQDAIDYVLDELRDFADCFLRAWREGDLTEWPEFYEWLLDREMARVVAFEGQSPEALRELDLASEAFASRVPWDNATLPPEGGLPDDRKLGELIWRAVYEPQGGQWHAVDPANYPVWDAAAERFRAMLSPTPPASRTPAEKEEG